MRISGILLSAVCLLAVANAAPIVDQQLFVQSALVSGYGNLEQGFKTLFFIQGFA